MCGDASAHLCGTAVESHVWSGVRVCVECGQKLACSEPYPRPQALHFNFAGVGAWFAKF